MGTEAEADVGLEIESDKAVLSLRSDFLPQMTTLHFVQAYGMLLK